MARQLRNAHVAAIEVRHLDSDVILLGVLLLRLKLGLLLRFTLGLLLCRLALHQLQLLVPMLKRITECIVRVGLRLILS
mgnify:CR=1 FL=1